MDREEQNTVPALKELEVPQRKIATTATLIKITGKVIADNMN